MQEKVHIVLENGSVFTGEPFGARGEATGEIVFVTSMTGYLETLTDPCYYGQIVVQTFPLIGNYGVIPSDFEHPLPHLQAYVVREWCQAPSNFRSEGRLDTFLTDHGIVGVWGVDTRQLTKEIRNNGTMQARITGDIRDVEKIVAELKTHSLSNAVAAVTSKEISIIPGPNPDALRVVLWDFGAKNYIARELNRQGCQVITVPAGTPAAEILALEPDGVVLSNGPGDPRDNPEIIAQVARITRSGKPVFAIGLGHQLLALAQGADTYKLKYGHRGASQPVKDLRTGGIMITTQNHGYVVSMDNLPPAVTPRYVNVNDGTCEGLEYRQFPGFSVQFQPDTTPGLSGEASFFRQFITMMEGVK